MRFVSVAERELRAAARRRSTYFTRWLTALAFFGMLLWLFWVMDGLQNRRIGAELFGVFAMLTFCYCLLLGTVRTADSLSSEKREGTLGLLFLTNLNSAEIVIGKLCSHALATVYGLLAVFPILGLPLLMGGVTVEEFGCTMLALLNAIFCSLTAGLVASVWEGLREHRWSAAQLTAFDAKLAGFKLLADYTNAIHRAVSAYIEVWQQYPELPWRQWQVPMASGGLQWNSEWAWQPRSWWYDRCRQLYDARQRTLAQVNFTNETILLTQEWDLLDGLPVSEDVEILLAPYLWGGPRFSLLAAAQTAWLQARLALALERYWLVYGAYPERLDQLVPTFLAVVPNDVVAGRPMAYERTLNHYVLRGVGPDGELHGKHNSADDWLWAFATNAPPVLPAP